MLSRLKGIETLTIIGLRSIVVTALGALDMLSRLKGIETRCRRLQQSRCCLALDMLSRLKGIETRCRRLQQSRCCLALDMLSRLKGIETRPAGANPPVLKGFGYAFPFEGN